MKSDIFSSTLLLLTIIKRTNNPESTRCVDSGAFYCQNVETFTDIQAFADITYENTLV